MLDQIIKLALRHRLFVVASAAFILVYGALTLRALPIDVFPDITKPTVTIMTEAHGMAPEEVESRVTLPIESYLQGLPGIERIRSQSGIGLSAIYVEFDWGNDIYRIRQLVQEKINLSLERLPQDVVPVLGPIGSLMGQIQQIAIYPTDDSISPMELRSLAEWVIRPRLLSVSGVSQVIAIGGGLKQYQVRLSAEKLNQLQLSLEQIDRGLKQISQNTTGGFLEKDGQELLIRNIGVINDIRDIQNTMIGLHFGRPVLIGEVAEVVEAPRLKRGDGSFNGKPAVILSIQKQPHADTVKITENIIQTLESLKPQLPKAITINPDVFKQATFIENSISGILGKLRWGSILVFLVLLVFLANLRMSAITLTAIPLSFLTTAIVFKIFGLSVNTMTLGGLAIAIGELVDDSIVDVENIFRRLQENQKKGAPQSILRVIYEASSEVRNSIVLATLIIAMVFLPLFALDGLEGRLFTPLGVSYLVALFSSLLISLTVTPVLCSFFLKTSVKEHSETQFVKKLKALDVKVLQWALPHAKIVLSVTLLMFLGSLSLYPFMGKDFLPAFNEGTAMISLIAPPGTNLEESNKIGVNAENIIRQHPEIKSTSRRTGRAEMDEHAAGVNISEIDIDFHEGGRHREDLLNEIRGQLKKAYPHIGVNVGQPLSHLIDHMLSGVSAAIAVKVFGPDLTVLRQKSAEIKNAVQDIPGLVDLRIEQQGLLPQVKIHILRDEATRFALSPGEVTELLETALNGKVVAQILEGAQIYEVYLQFDQGSRGSLKDLEQLIVKTLPNGRKLLLKELADIYETEGPNEIGRENNQRRMVVSANVSGRDLNSLVQEIQQKLQQKVEMPTGYYLDFGGQFKNQQQASKKLFIYGLASLIGIALLLYGHFNSVPIMIQVMATLPLSFIGGLVLLFFTDRVVSIASLIGFVTLCGISARNSIMMISHYLHLMKYEGETFSAAMIIRGSQERLVPVSMTALVASLALLPLVFAKGQPGSEILHPVAVVIVGGLITSTLLDVIVTPCLFYLYGQRSAKKYTQPNNQKDQI